jgi:hypothetical protein
LHIKADLSHKDTALLASPEFTIACFFVLLLSCVTSTLASTVDQLYLSSRHQHKKLGLREAMLHWPQ